MAVIIYFPHVNSEAPVYSLLVSIAILFHASRSYLNGHTILTHYCQVFLQWKEHVTSIRLHPPPHLYFVFTTKLKS